MWKNLLYVALGGAGGSVLRYLVSYLMPLKEKSGFPWATLSVNLVGCLIIGLLIGWLSSNHQESRPYLRLLLITGFCGGFTTFSAFATENFNLFGHGHISFALLYITASILGGILAVGLGVFIGSFSRA